MASVYRSKTLTKTYAMSVYKNFRWAQKKTFQSPFVLCDQGYFQSLCSFSLKTIALSYHTLFVYRGESLKNLSWFEILNSCSANTSLQAPNRELLSLCCAVFMRLHIMVAEAILCAVCLSMGNFAGCCILSRKWCRYVFTHMYKTLNWKWPLGKCRSSELSNFWLKTTVHF